MKGFWKYQIEKMRLRNFLRVTTRVTVRLAHSVVRTNTEAMQTYCVVTLARRQRNMTGTVRLTTGRVTGVEVTARDKWWLMSLYSSKNPGRGRAWE